MKPAVAVALILCGAILIVVPPLSNFFWGLNVTRLSEATHMVAMGLPGQMGGEYQFGCFAGGAAMIGIAIYASVWRCESA